MDALSSLKTVEGEGRIDGWGPSRRCLLWRGGSVVPLCHRRTHCLRFLTPTAIPQFATPLVRTLDKQLQNDSQSKHTNN